MTDESVSAIFFFMSHIKSPAVEFTTTGDDSEIKPQGPLRYGWTTGACAAAAAKAAFSALLNGEFPDPVSITLPRGQTPAFALAKHTLSATSATAGIIKDAGDDPDVTHGVLVHVTVQRRQAGSGLLFCAGEGVGTVTRAGLPVAPGEPAINPGPRAMIQRALTEVAASKNNVALDLSITIAIPGGEKIAQKTLNPRLGIVGGLSVLGTTGVVVPYSCSAWIHGIHRGIDVARAAGLSHVAGATGSSSEDAVAAYHNLPEIALIDMGDFVGGMLKYLRKHPVPRVTIAGGVAKITKLAQGFLDLHSRRGRVDLQALAETARINGADNTLRLQIEHANTTAEAFALATQASIDLGTAIAAAAKVTAGHVVANTPIDLEVLLFDRTGQQVGHAPFSH